MGRSDGGREWWLRCSLITVLTPAYRALNGSMRLSAAPEAVRDICEREDKMNIRSTHSPHITSQLPPSPSPYQKECPQRQVTGVRSVEDMLGARMALVQPGEGHQQRLGWSCTKLLVMRSWYFCLTAGCLRSSLRAGGGGGGGGGGGQGFKAIG